jgi:PAS domain S-box-containing protein
MTRELLRRTLGDDPDRHLAFLLELLGSLDEALWVRDLREERILYLSPGFAKIWGRPVEDVLASPRLWFESIHPDDRERVRTAAVEHARSGPDRVEYRIVRPDGSIRRVRDRAYPIRDAQGRVVRLAGFVEDVT